MILFIIIAVFIVLMGLISVKDTVKNNSSGKMYIPGVFSVAWGVAVLVFALLNSFILTLFFTFFGAGVFFIFSVFFSAKDVSVKTEDAEENYDGTAESRVISKKQARKKIMLSDKFNITIGIVFLVISVIILVIGLYYGSL